MVSMFMGCESYSSFETILRSSTKSRMRSFWRTMTSPDFLTSAGAFVAFAMRSACPIEMARGVRTSWLTPETHRLRACLYAG